MAVVLADQLNVFIDAAQERLDDVEDQLLILEEEFGAEYSNSGGPAANDLRVQKVANALTYMEESADRLELEGVQRVFRPAAEVARKSLKDGGIELDLSVVQLLLKVVDVGRELVEVLEGGERPLMADYSEVVDELLEFVE